MQSINNTMENRFAFDVVFLNSSSIHHHDSVSSLDLSFTSSSDSSSSDSGSEDECSVCNVDLAVEEQPSVHLARQRRSKQRKHNVFRATATAIATAAPMTPQKQKQIQRDLRRPNSMGEFEAKRSMRFNELCNKDSDNNERLVGRHAGTSSMRRRLLLSKASSRRASMNSRTTTGSSGSGIPTLNRWSDHGSTTIPLKGRVTSARNRICRAISKDSTVCTGDSSNSYYSRWGGSSRNQLLVLGDDNSSAQALCRPRRTLSNDDKNTKDNPRVLRTKTPCCTASNSKDDGDARLNGEIRKVCKAVLALTKEGEDDQNDDLDEAVDTAELSSSSCTSHLTKDLPSKLPSRQQSVEVDSRPPSFSTNFAAMKALVPLKMPNRQQSVEIDARPPPPSNFSTDDTKVLSPPERPSRKQSVVEVNNTSAVPPLSNKPLALKMPSRQTSAEEKRDMPVMPPNFFSQKAFLPVKMPRRQQSVEVEDFPPNFSSLFGAINLSHHANAGAAPLAKQLK